MGYFSWCCKGCGQEIREGERARLNGCKGVYDGYGRCGNCESDGEDVVAWHEACYRKATSEQKLDENPSRSAPDQGMGPIHLEFHEHFDPKAPIRFFPVVHAHREDGEKYQRLEYYLTKDGPKDQGEYDDHFREHDEHLPGPEPHSEALMFADLPAAKQALQKMIADLGLQQYDAYVFGQQYEKMPWGEILPAQPVEGSVYETERHEICKWNHETNELVRTGQFKTKEWETGSH